jgi:cyclase
MDWPASSIEVADGVFAYVQAGGGLCIANAGILVGPDETTVIDALFTPAMTSQLLAEARRRSAAPIARLIDTHHHVDHTLGNACFPATTQVVAHARAREEMARAGLSVLDVIRRLAPHFAGELDDVHNRLPDTTFDGDALDLVADGRRLRLLHFGTGHTRGDVLVHLPAERVLFAGDVAFFGVTPLGHEGHIGNWIAVGERVIAEIEADVIVPGHGPPGTKADLTRMLDYLRLVHASARSAFDAGASVGDAVASIALGEFAEWGEPERLGANVARCYAEFRGEIEP